MTTKQYPVWERPAYYGHPAAIDAMGTVAAPFLAGIGIALAVLVISNEGHFGWAGESLFALVAATVALIACVECSFGLIRRVGRERVAFYGRACRSTEATSLTL
jgi:hypothetical protein